MFVLRSFVSCSISCVFLFCVNQMCTFVSFIFVFYFSFNNYANFHRFFINFCDLTLTLTLIIINYTNLHISCV